MNNEVEQYNQEDEEIIKEAQDNIWTWFSYWEDNIERGEKSLRFYLGDQWEPHEIEDYHIRKKELLTYNKCRPFVQQVIGEYRQNTPDVKVRAKELTSSQDEVDNVEGLLRAISYESKADIIFQTDLENTAIRGYGAHYVYTEYEDKKSFNQILKIGRIEDPNRTFFDLKAKNPCKDDGDYCGKYEAMTKKEFMAKYPDIEFPVSFSDQLRQKYFEWGTDKSIIICDYYRKEWFKVKLNLLANNQTLTDKELKALPQQNRPRVVATREENDYKIIHYRLIENQILAKTEWPSKFLPLIYVDGPSLYVDGAQYTSSFIYGAIDPQRFLNYAVSETANFLKISHRGKYVFTTSQLKQLNKDQLKDWLTPDRAAILVADPDKKTGQMPAPLPTPVMPPDLMNIWQAADDNIESVLGRYGVIKGMDSNVISGVAENVKIRQGNTTVITLFDNNNRAIEHTYKVLLEMIPRVYDNQRMIQIRRADKTQETIPINYLEMNSLGLQTRKFGEGKFDVEVSVGPNFAMQKSDALQQLLTLTQSNPAIAQLIPDLIVANLDLENVNQIVDRVKTLVPPQILAQESGQPMPPQQPQQPDPQMMLQEQQVQAKMAQAEADRVNAQAKMMDAQRRSMEAGLGIQTAHTRAQAEIGKAELDYRSNIAKAIHSSKEEMLKRENELLKSELERHKRLTQLIPYDNYGM
jgi:hypothetical protein